MKFRGERWLETDLSHLNVRGGRVKMALNWCGAPDGVVSQVVSQVTVSDCHVFKTPEIDCQDMKLPEYKKIAIFMHCERQDGRLKCGVRFLKIHILEHNGSVWTLGGLASTTDLY